MCKISDLNAFFEKEEEEKIKIKTLHEKTFYGISLAEKLKKGRKPKIRRKIKINKETKSSSTMEKECLSYEDGSINNIYV